MTSFIHRYNQTPDKVLSIIGTHSSQLLYLYLAIVLDLFLRKVVGRAMAEQMNIALVDSALRMTLQTRQPAANLLHDSGQGSQYTSAAYESHFVDMSRVGNCHDNAVTESLFGTLKSECAIS